jgi:hypothetical protein
VSLDEILINRKHHSSDNCREKRSPECIYSNHIPTPALHHTHRCELIGHIRPESEECRFLEYLYDCELGLDSWEHDEDKEHKNIEQIKSYRRNIVHIGIEICRDIFPKCREYHEPYHDCIEDEKSQKS